MESKKGGNGRRILFSEEIYKDITEILAELAAKTRAKSIIFADLDGYPITKRGEVTGMNINTLSALAASDFAATAEMARLLGERDKFKFLFHEGEKMNLYLSNVGDEFLLLVVFDSSVALGMIRIYTHKAIQSLEKFLETAEEKAQKVSQILDLEFSTLLSRQLDKSLA